MKIMRTVATTGFLAALALPAGAQQELLRVYATPNSNLLGWSVDGAGDLNDDGVPDVIVGGRVRTTGSNTDDGQAIVFSGVDGSHLLTMEKTDTPGRFGWAVAGPGDTDGDGTEDFLVGQPLSGLAAFTQAGRGWIISGVDGVAKFAASGATAFDNAGWSVDGMGDLNNDGHMDYIVGHRGFSGGSDQGRAKVYSGIDNSGLFSKTGVAAGDQFGTSVSNAGDVNNDGTNDFIVGAPRNDKNAANGGMVRVFSGADGTRLYQFTGKKVGNLLGQSVSGAGDVNNDGFDDVIAGMPGDGAGAAKVFSGLDGSLIFRVDGDAAGDSFGTSVSGAGDVNGDGYDDFMVGAPKHDAGGLDAGLVRLFSGRTGALLYNFFGNTAGDNLGQSIRDADDLNDDGLADVILGAPFDATDPSGMELSDPGQASVHAGNDLFLTTNLPYPVMGDSLTLTTSGAEAGGKVMLFLTAFNGVPISIQLGPVGTLGPDGTHTLSGPLPGGLAGSTATFASFGFDANGSHDTEPLTLEFK